MLIDKQYKNNCSIGLRCGKPSCFKGMSYFEHMNVKSELLCEIYTILFEFSFLLSFLYVPVPRSLSFPSVVMHSDYLMMSTFTLTESY